MNLKEGRKERRKSKAHENIHIGKTQALAL